MLEQSQKLTDGLIIYSVLVSDYEKLDFKNDALAGVRANYFNSGCKEQKEITEIELHGMDYKMSCLLTKNEPLSWKVTRDNLPYQSVKRATGGVYSVITYNDREIVFKRQFFDRNHTWLRTEYFNRSIADKLITRIYPRKVSGIITLVTEDIDDNGIVSVKTLFPSDKQSNENSRVLIYSNVGMLWYDASFLPSDMPFTEKKSYGNSGFVFNGDLFKNDFVPENAYNLEDCAYLTDEDIPNVSDTAEPVSKKDYSAYDIIEKILVEAHKTNKDLFGEIINHTAEEDFEPAEVKIVTGEKDEQLSDDEVEENSQISEHEIADDTDAVAETADEQTEDSESAVTVDSPEFGIITKGTFQLQPFGKGNLSGDVCQKVISFCLVRHHIQRTDRIADTSIPLRFLSGTAPVTVFILHRLGGECFHRISDAIASSFFHVRTECQVSSELQPFIDLGITICLEIETTVINAFHDTGLVEETAGYIVMCLFRTTGIANRIALFHSRT